MKTNWIVVTIVIVLMVIAGFILSNPTSAQRFGTNKTMDRNNDEQIVITIPVESGTFAYNNLNRGEAIPYGPNSISVTDEGNVLIGNWVDNTATELSLAGDVLAQVKFEGSTSLNDVRKINGSYYAVDRTADEVQVVSNIGETTKVEKNVFRFSPRDGSANVADTTTADLVGREQKLDGSQSQRADNLTVSPGLPFDADANVLKVSRGQTVIAQWNTLRPIAETRLLGSLANGDFFIVAYEMIGTDRIRFDQLILHFNVDGALIEMARVPQNQYYNVTNDAALAADGNVYVLMPRAKSLDILRMKFEAELQPAETVPADAEFMPLGGDALTLPSRTRQQIADTANYYFNTSTNIPASRITGTCGTTNPRVKPSYLTSGGSYASVPYSWGGWDSPLDMANKMSGTTSILAGHVANYYSSCSVRPAGVDCSGFVGQTWGLPGHPFYTGNVVSSGYARTIAWDELRQGDALNLSGTHIMLYVSGSYGNTISTWEATGDPGIERAARHSRPWSQARNYQPIRYNGVSETQIGSFSVSASITQTVTQGQTANYAVSVTSRDGFTGPVSLSVLNLPSGYSTSNTRFSPQIVTPPANGTAYSILSIGTTTSTAVGTFIITIRGTSGSRTSQIQSQLIVQRMPAPSITSYSWTSTPRSGLAFGGYVYGRNFFASGTQVYFCKTGTSTCYLHPSAGVAFNSSTKLTLSGVRLSTGSWQFYVRTTAGQSAKSSSFTVY